MRASRREPEDAEFQRRAPVEERHDAEPLPEVAGAEREPSALTRVDRGMGQRMLLSIQQGQGNAYASRLMAARPAVGRLKAPSAEESVGTEPGTAHFLDDPTTKDPADVLALGDAGFTFQMLKDVPKAAGTTFAYYREAHLETVKPDFAKLDDVQLPYVTDKLTKAQDELDAAEGKGWWRGRTIPSVIESRKQDRDYSAACGQPGKRCRSRH